MKKKTPRDKCWDMFSEMIRAKYADWRGYVRCYTCGKVGRWKGDRFQAGHFTCGRGNSILFDEQQIRVQCYQCNCCNHGEQDEFGQRLRREIGEESVKQIKKRKHETVKYSKKDYEAMEKVFKEKRDMYLKEKGLDNIEK